MSPQLRQQVIFAFHDIIRISRLNSEKESALWKFVAFNMRREKGVSLLHVGNIRSIETEVISWFKEEQNLDYVLDAVELVTRSAFSFAGYYEDECLKQIEVLNARFLEAGFGYQVHDGTVMQISDEYTHREIVLPALELLSEQRFAGANAEFRKAHREYRAGEYENCLIDCLKAFESVLKVIAAKQGWEVEQTATAKHLIQAAYDNQLVPDYMQSQFSGLRSMLGGVPTVRNKEGGHGQGTEERVVPKRLAAFQLSQTAASIVFFVESEIAL